jgi:hypothetical protein
VLKWAKSQRTSHEIASSQFSIFDARRPTIAEKAATR